MVLSNHNNGSRTHASEPDLQSFKNGETFDDYTTEAHRFREEIDSNCSTPYVSAPSSPGRGGPSGYFFSAPASPVHFVLSSAQASSDDINVPGSFEFEFSSRISSNASVGPGSMSSADELFFNGQIRPIKLSSHLRRPQILAPLLDLEVEEDEESKDDINREKREETVMRGRDMLSRNRSLSRKTRSMSPLRNSQIRWPEVDLNAESDVTEHILELDEKAEKQSETPSTETTPSVSASTSRSSSSGRNSKKWIFLKDLLYRSKSEGRANAKEKFWSSISLSPAKEKNASIPSISPSSSTETQKQKRTTKQPSTKKNSTGKPANGVAKRRGVPPSPHELHYTANRAQAEEMKKKTFLPYRQGLFGCLGFSSKGYGALNGFTRTLNPVSSR